MGAAPTKFLKRNAKADRDMFTAFAKASTVHVCAALAVQSPTYWPPKVSTLHCARATTRKCMQPRWHCKAKVSKQWAPASMLLMPTC